MIAGIILVILGFFLFLLPPWFVKLIGLICFVLGVISILRNAKTFLFELIDHIKGTSKPNYQDEARRACGKAAPKRDKNATPPWEE